VAIKAIKWWWRKEHPAKAPAPGRRTTETIGLTASSYVWGPGMLKPLIDWAEHMGYGYSVYAQYEEGNPNLQVVFKASPRHVQRSDSGSPKGQK
jgi:hypothetical protein